MILFPFKVQLNTASWSWRYGNPLRESRENVISFFVFRNPFVCLCSMIFCVCSERKTMSSTFRICVMPYITSWFSWSVCYMSWSGARSGSPWGGWMYALRPLHSEKSPLPPGSFQEGWIEGRDEVVRFWVTVLRRCPGLKIRTWAILSSVQRPRGRIQPCHRSHAKWHPGSLARLMWQWAMPLELCTLYRCYKLTKKTY